MQSSFNSNFVRSVKPQRDHSEAKEKSLSRKQAKKERDLKRSYDAHQSNIENDYFNSYI